MSMPTIRNDIAFELAPHQLSNVVYNAQSSVSPYLLPPSTTPIVFDSVKYPAVDGQYVGYYMTPRVFTGASGSMGIYGGYRQTQSVEEAQSPAELIPPVGRPMPPQMLLNYLGCPIKF